MNKYKNKIDQFTISFVCILFYSFGAFKESESNLVIFLCLLQLAILQNRNSSDLWLSEYYLNLRSNKNFIRCLVEQDRLALNEVSERLRADKDIVMAAVQQNGFALRYGSETLRADKDIVMAAVINNGLSN